MCILLVDDDTDMRDAMCRVLVQAGHCVVEAGSGDAAAELIGEAGPFDILVTDVRMPGFYDGVALAECWREKVPGHPILFVSGDTGGRLNMDTLGPYEVLLLKPFRRTSLLDAVRLLLTQHITGVSPAPALAPASPGQGGAALPVYAP